MAAGLEIRNEQGFLQFSPSIYPFTLKSIQDFSANGTGTPIRVGGNTGVNLTAFYTIPISVGFSPAVIALSTTGGTRAVVFNQSGGTANIAFTHSSGSVKVYAFGSYSAAPDPGFGFALYNESGALTYSVLDKPLKPLSFYAYTIPEDYSPVSLYDFSAPGKTLAYVNNNFGAMTHHYDDYSRTPVGERIMSIEDIMPYTPTASSISVSTHMRNRVRLGNAQGEPDTYSSFRSGSITIIDVTGY